MKINYKDVIHYIETHNDIKLFNYQKKALKAIIENKNIFIPRCSGLSTILQGLGEFIIMISKSPGSYDAGRYSSFEYDEIITLDEVMSEVSEMSEEQAILNKSLLKKLKKNNEKKFKQEFDILNSFK